MAAILSSGRNYKSLPYIKEKDKSRTTLIVKTAYLQQIELTMYK